MSTLSSDPVPVTLLSGFLGSGKTTLLNRMLSECGDQKLALLVNDVGQVNVDASLVKTRLRELDDSATQMVELSNGCICCSIQGDLAEAVEELVRNSGADHIVIEASGVAEPTQVMQAFYARNLFGKQVIEIAPLNALVTVIDSSLFLREWNRIHNSDASVKIVRPDEDQPVFELLIEQIECSDILLLNKKDLLSEEERSQVVGLISGLNPRAQCELVEQSHCDVPALLSARVFKMEDTIGAPRWMKELEAEEKGQKFRFQASSETKHLSLLQSDVIKQSNSTEDSGFALKYGLATFVYRSRIPFKAFPLSQFLKKNHAGLLRVKGFAWIDERTDQVALVSIAGDVNRCDFIADWWAVRFEKGQVTKDQFPEEVKQSWREPFGDRRQEIVFIGIGMDEEAIRSDLDACQVKGEDLR